MTELLEEQEEVGTRVTHLVLGIHCEEVAKLDVTVLESLDLFLVPLEVALDLVEMLACGVRVVVSLFTGFLDVLVSGSCLVVAALHCDVLLLNSISVQGLRLEDLALLLEPIRCLSVRLAQLLHDEVQHALVRVVLGACNLVQDTQLVTIGLSLGCTAIHDIADS